MGQWWCSARGLLLAVVGWGGVFLAIQPGWAQAPAPPLPAGPPRNARELVKLRAFYDQTVWSPEMEAQRHETYFVRLWDRLIHESDPYRVLAESPFERLEVGTEPRAVELDWGIRISTFGGRPRVIRAEDWASVLAEMQQAGFEIVETEWHHSAFHPNDSGPNSSVVSMAMHVQNRRRDARYIIKGDLHIEWQEEGADYPIPSRIDATGLKVLERVGTPAFTEQQRLFFPLDPRGREHRSTIHPVMVYDLDQDGLPEVILGGVNRILWNEGNWTFRQETLCTVDPGHVNGAVLADFTGDGVVDYLCAVQSGWPKLYAGEPRGRFTRAPRVLTFAGQPLNVPLAMTAGDIDSDGDLDLFIGQQKPGYATGDIPAPYYDALDGFPWYLLENDGRGNFRDVTQVSGLGPKRQRRNFSATLVDLDDDSDLDLLCTSDFSGADLFLNDGRGGFEDVTDKLMPKPYAYGMSHTFGDYNLDGRLDFLLVGMSSTTARRLTGLNLGREDFEEYNARRKDMGYGNRMYLRTATGFEQAPFNDSIARTGWSWGSSTLDFDNDGDQDIYVANGQTSGKTTRDYCTRFWCHDIYKKPGAPTDQATRELFQRMGALFTGDSISWNGYEKNALLMNLDGKDFLNVGFLMGASSELDSRTVVTGDLDADGRVDMIFEHNDLKNQGANVIFLRNQWDMGGNWIGFRLRGGPSTAIHGAKVRVELEDGRMLVQHHLTGHSVWTQHDAVIHFGLGPEAKVASATITWANGETTRLAGPEINSYHTVQAKGP